MLPSTVSSSVSTHYVDQYVDQKWPLVLWCWYLFDAAETNHGGWISNFHSLQLQTSFSIPWQWWQMKPVAPHTSVVCHNDIIWYALYALDRKWLASSARGHSAAFEVHSAFLSTFECFFFALLACYCLMFGVSILVRLVGSLWSNIRNNTFEINEH